MLTAQQIIERLTTEQIISLCCDLQGSSYYAHDSHGNPIFSTMLDHPDTSSGSYKLYYYTDSKKFFCYTTWESYDVFEMVKRALGLGSFKDAVNYIIDYFKLNRFDEFTFGFEDDEEPDNDIWQTIDNLYSCYTKDDIVEDRVISENILEFFYPLAAPTEWLKEYINPEVMNFYGIRIDPANQKIIIPQRNVNGELVGIRGRSFNCKDIDDGRKYMPIKIEDDLYNCPLGNHLYGLYQNKNYIARRGEVLLVEAEKSVLQMSSFYSLEECYAVAVCGFNVSHKQIDLLLDTGVQNVIIGFDRDFMGNKGDYEFQEYKKKLLRVAKPLLPYFNVYIIMDDQHLLPYKGSPTDCGKEVYEQLYKRKFKVTEEMLETRRVLDK